MFNHSQNISIMSRCQIQWVDKIQMTPKPIIGKGYKWSVGALKDAQTRSHTIHLETNCWTCNCILRHQYCV
jgi:hypothetical protein